MKRALCLAALVALIAAPSWAGLYYKARTWQEGGAASEQMDMRVEAWVEGDSAKIQFAASGHPFMKEGTYLLTTDGGRLLYLVNPQEKTYGEWDLEAMLRMVGQVMEGLGPMFKMSFSDLRSETLLEEDGGKILGLPTTHYRYRTAYALDMKIMGMKRSQTFETLHDVWATEAIDEAAFGVWMRKEPPSSGNEELDKMIALETERIKGVPLKMVQEATSADPKGRQQVTRTITEVEQLERVAVAASTFEIPADYQQTQLMPSLDELGQQGAQPEGEDEEEEKPTLKKLFGRKKG